ncbi:hypothetical protein SLNWT_4789 [Streptomyces albus]|uniref:Uncharacterized protein n=1 Tax=Streptomyces albus (strain ATCC 21838 / DSM 41398 / FERM P-419 / JCM 4703 / NBRC 107858) TaxID=1081613 RepID=A0A0B5F0P7_STRA4|nr:hypothetical protein SLNWT_4789 [Streptomyces albus]AOU79471.1 hypothetical protein SLNHY_4780 [Streptomyces albus]
MASLGGYREDRFRLAPPCRAALLLSVWRAPVCDASSV